MTATLVTLAIFGIAAFLCGLLAFSMFAVARRQDEWDERARRQFWEADGDND
jgi:hypothetical protein